MAKKGDGPPGDWQANIKATRDWHNRLTNGSVSRSLYVKIGKQPLIDTPKLGRLLEQQKQNHERGPP